MILEFFFFNVVHFSLLKFLSGALKHKLKWTNAALSSLMVMGRLRPSFMSAARRHKYFLFPMAAANLTQRATERQLQPDVSPED